MTRVVTIEPSGLPPQEGTRMLLLGIEELPPSGEFGRGYRLEFEMLDGPNVGETAVRTLAASLRSGSVGGKFIAGAFGLESLPTGREIDLDRLVGREFIGSIAPSPSGSGTRVERVRPA